MSERPCSGAATKKSPCRKDWGGTDYGLFKGIVVAFSRKDWGELK
jgi:hypothetical protein